MDTRSAALLRWTGRTESAASSATCRARHAARLIKELAALYPALDGICADDACQGFFATTPDGLPYVGRHRRYPRQLFALGYGGNGMTFGYLAAQILLRAAQGAMNEEDRFCGISRIQVRLHNTGRASAGV